MSLQYVTITGGSPIEVYGGLPAATAYIGAMIGDAATAWRALVPDDQARTLIQGTRYLDRLSWQGTANQAGGTTLQWARSNVVLADGTPVDPTTVPAAIVNATFEMAALIAADPDILNAVDQSANVRGLGAGSARIDFFNPTQLSDGSATKLPYVVQQLVAQYLGGAVATSAGLSQGGTCESIMQPCEDLNRRWPF